MRRNLSIFKYCLLLFLGWRVALLFIAWFGLSTFPSRNGLTDEIFLPASRGEPSGEITYWFRWSNWDGGHFRGIAEHGYSPEQTVFFPLYPLLMKILSMPGLDTNFAGLLISHLSLLLTLFLLYKLTLLDFPEKVAKRAIFALLIFPTSFYFGTVYSESLFLAATLAGFYFARINKTALSSFFAATAVATRLTGLAVFAAILGNHLLDDNNFNFKKILTLKTFLLCLSLLPIPLYMFFQQALFQNPFGFLTNEAGWNRHFTLPWEPVLGYLNYLRTVGIFQIGNAARVFTELVFFTGGVVGFVFSLYKLRPGYSIFYFLSLILPVFSGTLIAMPRYMLTIFPIFILLGIIENEILQKIGIIFSVLLLSAYTMLFMGWYWVT